MVHPNIGRIVFIVGTPTKIKDVYKYKWDYKKLIYLDRQKEGEILIDATLSLIFKQWSSIIGRFN